MSPLRVDDLADVRAGDKGATLILAVFPRNQEAFELLRDRLTTDVVARHFRCEPGVSRTLIPQLPALTFRLPGVLGSGVTNPATHDGHGKTLGYHLLGLSLDG